ncbi:MAG TPA: dephospho-CoA kinase [Defluviitaleaceae bacterium]|nr:dephospho-CoA kinase [Candidatus Epulonipiscium sp.]HOA82298.1 dephospho-CoA kinase [Defluviitaleaceae bacterium]
MKVIGITGGSGSGKSTVASLLSQITSAYIINADKIGHDILKKGKAAYYPIVEKFGKSILNSDGEINRSKLGKIVFSNKNLLKTLNEITHPLIVQEILDIINEIKTNTNSYKYIVIDAALLIESGLHEVVDEIWLVYADEDIRVNRIVERDGITKEEAKQRINSQMLWEELKKYGDIIIDNGKDKEFTNEQINNIVWTR